MMRKIDDLTLPEARAVLRRIWTAMYVDQETGVVDPDKEWGADTLDDICNALGSVELNPDDHTQDART